MAAGLGFKTFTTGEVLTAGDVNGYLMQGINVFASEAARNAAITSPQEGQFAYTKDNNSLWYYSGSAWVASGATGDIEGVTVTSPLTGGGTSGTVTVGILNGTTSNLGAVQLSDSVSSTSTTLAATANAVKTAYDLAASNTGSVNVAGKNFFLNSNFSIWQRGTSMACSSTAYSADRWQAYRTVAGATVSRQLTNDTTNLPFIQYGARVQRDSGNTSTTLIFLGQSLETVNSIPLVGKTVSFSFYARAGANYSAASSALSVIVSSGTGTDQNVLTSYTGANNFISSTATLTTTWQRFTYTGTVPTTAQEVGTYIYYTPVGTAGANDWFEITGVQLEIAGSASAYSPNTSTYALELAACQRYFVNFIPSTADYGTVISMFQATSSTTAKGGVQFPVPMRTSASLVFSTAGNFTLANSAFTPIGVSSITYAVANSTSCRIDMSVASGLTAGDATALSGNNANLLAQASAEL